MNYKNSLDNLNYEPSISAPAYLDLYDILKKRDIHIADEEIGIDRSELLNIEKRIPISMGHNYGN